MKTVPCFSIAKPIQGVATVIAMTFFAASSAEAASRYLVKLKPQVQTLAAVSHLQLMGAQVVDEIPELGIVITDQKVAPSFAEYVEENALWYTTDIAANDEGLSKMTAQVRAKIQEGWNIFTGSRDVIVGVVDTGIDFNHPDLIANIYSNPREIADDGIDNDGNGFVDDVHGWNFASNKADPMDDNMHGTHVSGIIGAEGNNGIGIAGVNWKVRLMPLKFLTAQGSGTTDAAAKAIIYGVNNGAKILNNSWGGGPASKVLEDAIRYASDRGVLFLAAAGNSSANVDSKTFYPSGYNLPNIISVGSTENYGKLSKFSNYGGIGVHLAAPGTDVYSTVPGAAYKKLSGTSMAAPVVTGAAALLWGYKPNLSMMELKNALINGVTAYAGYEGKIASGGEIDIERVLAQTDGGFQIWPGRMSVAVGSTLQMTAYRAPSSVQWSVVDGTLAKVDANGLVTAIKEGTTTVQAVSGGQTVRSSSLKLVQKPSSSGPGCSRTSSQFPLASAETASHLFGMLLPYFVGVGFQIRARRKKDRV